MQVVENEIDNVLIKYMKLSYRYSENIVVSNRIVYQLPCQIKNRSFSMKIINKHWHQGKNKYWINSKRITCEKFNSLLIKSDELIEIDSIKLYPF